MLTRLFVSNIVLIDRLELDLRGGLSVLTGETGAGKSILMDALALALGARTDTGLIRHGAESAQVIAEFDNAPDLPEFGIEKSDEIILRRTLATDGKSKAYINDIPVSMKVLKEIGDALVEIHGQFENHSLLDPATHMRSLDEFGKYDLAPVRAAYQELHAAEKELKRLRELLEKSAAEREFLEHNVAELQKLAPLAGEEDELSARRAQLMDAEKNAAILAEANEVLNKKGQGLDEQIFSAAHILQRIKTEPNPYQAQIDKLYEMGEAAGEIAATIIPADTDTATLEEIEERLFALRAAARKHRAGCDKLADKLIEMQTALSLIDNSDAELKKINALVKQKKSEYEKFAARLTQERIAAAAKLRAAIMKELPDLKLGTAEFDVEITAAEPGADGSDAVLFLIKANPGTPFAPLHKIASGGELARLMLALRVVLAGNNKTLIFDEVDTGISGATAAAVGERLSRLARAGQVVVITHSAQVAGFGDTHFLISKNTEGATTSTQVLEVAGDARLKEIARIISGAKITPESVRQAKLLCKNG